MVMNATTLLGAKTVTGSIRSWRNYAKVDSESVLTDAQNWLYSILRVREMRAAGTITVTTLDSEEALPTGFLDPVDEYVRDVTHQRRLKIVSEQRLEELRSWDAGTLREGEPSACGIYGEAFQFDTRVDEGFTGRIAFYKKPDMLAVTSNETNFLTVRYSHVLRPALMAFAAAFEQEWEDYASELRRAEAYAERVMGMDEMSRRTQSEPVEDGVSGSYW